MAAIFSPANNRLNGLNYGYKINGKKTVISCIFWYYLMMQPGKPTILAISRRHFNEGIDRGGGAIDRPLNSPYGDNDYFLFAVDGQTGWETMHTLRPIHDTYDRERLRSYTSVKLPLRGILPENVAVLAGEKTLLEHAKRVANVQVMSSVERLIERYRSLTDRPAHVSSEDKIMPSHELLREKVDAFRAEWQRAHGRPPIIGFNSGAYDLPHANHTRFLDAARKRCDFLVVAVASDRTVREQKGEDRPFVPEDDRAAHIAGMQAANAVIISDEYYHDALMKALRPDVMFKGDDYRGKEIIGAPPECRVEIIEVNHAMHSSSIVAKIRQGQNGGSAGPNRPG